MNDPRVNYFVNQQVRRQAERVRAMQAELASMLTIWSAEIQSLATNSAAVVIEDGRADEGVSQLTGQDLHDFMYGLGLIKAAMDGIAAQTINKPCVRGLEIY